MKLEYIREDNNNWYDEEVFYISETEPEEINYINENDSNNESLTTE